MTEFVSIIVTLVILHIASNKRTPHPPKQKDIYLANGKENEFIIMIYKSIMFKNPYYNVTDKIKRKEALEIQGFNFYGERNYEFDPLNQFTYYNLKLIGYINNDLKVYISICINSEIVIMIYCNVYTKKKILSFSKNDSLEYIVNEICKLINEIDFNVKTRSK